MIITNDKAQHLWGRVYAATFTLLYNDYFDNGVPIEELEEEAAGAADAAVRQFAKRCGSPSEIYVEDARPAAPATNHAAPKATPEQLREAANAIFK